MEKNSSVECPEDLFNIISLISRTGRITGSTAEKVFLNLAEFNEGQTQRRHKGGRRRKENASD
jgi:hypothetical protein